MKTNHRIIQWLALLALLLAPVLAQAQFTYAITNGTITITNYTGSGGAVPIPDTIDGLTVTSIGDYAFGNCFYLTSVYFTGNAPTAGVSAFQFDPATAFYLAGTTGWDSLSAAPADDNLPSTASLSESGFVRPPAHILSRP